MPAAINPPVVLVLGASGLLGRAVQHTLLESLPHGVVVAGTGHSRARGLIPCDVTDETTLREFLAAQAPRVVVNCVAERRPDVVEKEDAKAHVLNVRLVEILAEESARLGFYLLHISTDYVFDGTKPPYKPGDDPHPLNAYGEQKLASEKVLRGKDSGERACAILRVPVLYGPSADLAESSVTLLARDVLVPPRSPQKKVDDWAARYATHTEDVARVVTAMVDRALTGAGELRGTFHYSSKERSQDLSRGAGGEERSQDLSRGVGGEQCPGQGGGRAYTKYSISVLIGEVLGRATKHLEPEASPPEGGPRPQDCELDISALQEALGEKATRSRALRDGLREVLQGILGETTLAANRMPPPPSSAARLRLLLAGLSARQESLALPGAFNGLVARAVANAGFEATYVSGAGVAAGMGLPDVGLAGLEDMTRVIRDVSACSGLPLLADADTGGEGGEGGVRRVVMEYRRAGAAALHVEDQVFPKRCGHLEGKELVPADEFALKVQAAARARDEGRVAGEEGGGNGGLMICARTDARSVVGVEEVIERAKRYVDAGADMIFPEGLCSGDEFLRVSQALKGYNGVNGGEGPYLLANMTEFGKTPLLSVRRMGALGYHATIFPMTLFRWAMRGVVEALEELREGGRVSKTALREGRLLTREETYELLGYTPGRVWEYPNANSYSRRKGTRRSDFVQEGKEVMEEEDENEASGYGEEDPKKK